MQNDLNEAKEKESVSCHSKHFLGIFTKDGFQDDGE
jgi:hypothetical protein